MIARSRCFSLALAAPFLFAGRPDAVTELRQLNDVPVLNLAGEPSLFGEHLDESVTVLAYTGVGCPIAGKYAPRLTRFSEEYGKQSVRFVGINANPQDSCTDIAKDVEELELGFPVLRDFRQELTRRLDAKTTTEVFLFDGKGNLRYRGAVDDQYSLGAARPEPTKRFLATAIEAVLEGEDPPIESTDAPGCKITRLPEDALPEAVTWSSHVAKIVQKNCEICHRPDAAGPFSLQSYERAKGWGEMIASVVEEERMPPWNADEKFDGVFANERGLTKQEREAILCWIADGMPRGNPEEEPAPVSWPEGWTIGEPDAVFAMEKYLRYGKELPEEGFRVPREGTVEYTFFTAQTDFSEDRWIQAMEVRPGAVDVVHHVLVMLDDPNDGRNALSRDQDFLNYLAVAVPGDTPSVFPEGYAKRLPKGARLIFQMHYTPNGKERFDRSSIAMVFAKEPPIFEVESNAVLNTFLKIPPGEGNFEVRAELVLSEDTGIVSFFPHMHTRGKDFQFIAHYPDGASEELLFSHYDFNWQETYILPDPMLLPSGTRIECVAHYDNSAENPNNPAPDEWVEWGDQTWEEMFVGYYDHVKPLEY